MSSATQFRLQRIDGPVGPVALVTMDNGSVSATSNTILWPGNNSLTVTCAGTTPGGTGTFSKKGVY